jgi:uncharacterized membrane protein YadS
MPVKFGLGRLFDLQVEMPVKLGFGFSLCDTAAAIAVAICQTIRSLLRKRPS